MSRPRKKKVPAYQQHSSGRARVRTYDAGGRRVEYLLPGEYGSKESLDAYAELVERIQAGGGVVHTSAPAPDITVAELVEKYLREHVEKHHRGADGMPTSEVASITTAVKPFVRLFADEKASKINPLALRAYREVLITGSWRNPDEEIRRRQAGKQGPLTRRTVNAHVGRVKRMFRWAVSLCLVPADVLTGLDALPGLQPGRSEAKDLPPVEAVPLEHVEATIDHAPEMIGDLIHLQLFSGCRAGELLMTRTCDIDQGGPDGCWTLTPEKHKSKWRGHKRTIVFGPKCQLILRRYILPEEPERKLFRPRDTPYAKSRPNAFFRDHYTVDVFDIAIGRAAIRAGVPHWSSHQLRHLAARIAERELSLESARQFLGHKGADLTAMYSGLDTKAAAEVARKIG